MLGVVAVFLSVLHEQYCHLVHGPFFWLGDGSSNLRMRRAEAIKLIDAKWGDSEVAMALAFSTVCV